MRYTNPKTGKRAVAVFGTWPQVRLPEARKTAALMLKSIAKGEEPKKLPPHISVSAFAARWMAEVVEKARKDPAPVARVLKRDVLPLIGHRRLTAVTSEAVRSMIFAKRDAGRPEAAANLRHLLKRLFDYAVVCELIDRNPVAGTPLKYVTKHKSRTRALSQAELVQFFRKLPALGYRHAAALELVLLTLCRKGELLGARWKHVDLGQGIWEVPAELSKSGLPHVVYLSRQALAIFRILGNAAMPEGFGSGVHGRSIDPEAYVFPAQNSHTQPQAPTTLNMALRRVNWGIPHFTVHDLRRTASTHLNEKGYPADVIEKALNHAVRGGVRGVYNRAQYAAERKKMLEEWADWLEEMKDGG
jgi:integrase